MRLSIKHVLLSLILVLFPTGEALAECATSLTIVPGSTIDIGVAEGKKFVSVPTVENGTLKVVVDGTKYILRYTAATDKANVTEKVACEIEGEAKKTVEITISSIPSLSQETIYGAAAKTLVLLFALAVLLESALAAVFRWRPFAEILNPRAVRPLVAVLLSWWFVRYFGLDVVTALVNASNDYAPKPINAGGQLLTALVLAGGSSGINSILVALGVRQVSTLQNAPKPPPTKAWIAVRAIRPEGDKGGDIEVMIGPKQTLSNGSSEAPFVGTIKGKSGLGFLAFFARDRGRFPGYGGFEVDPSQELFVVLRYNGNDQTWGPHKAGAGAIIDLDFKVSEYLKVPEIPTSNE